MKKNLEKLVCCCLMVSTVLSGTDIITATAKTQKLALEKKQTYIVKTQSDVALKNVGKTYESVDTVSDLSKNIMKEENILTLELTQEEAKKLEKDNSVSFVEPDVMVQGSAHGIEGKKVKKIKSRKVNKEIEWNLQAVHMKKTKDKVSSKNKVKVALLDSGVDMYNDIEVKEFINLIPGEEEVLPLFWDTSGHGTSIAGIIAAQDNEEGITGINPNIELYSARVLDGDLSAPVSRIVEAIYWAIDKDVDILNISFGTTQYSEALEIAIKEAYNRGILIVAAAGNHGVVEYPAAFEEVVAVGGTDTTGQVCDYSAKGEALELVAPSEQICSTGSFDGTVICNGTSMAVPHVVGVAAKLWEKDKTVSADFIRQLMNVSANQYGDTHEYGNGLVDYEQAVEVYDEFAETYEPENTVGEQREIVGENESAVEEFVDVEYVNGSWSLSKHEECAVDGISYNGLTNPALINAMKKGVIYPDQDVSGEKGMVAHPYLHGYFKDKSAKCNYIAAYIQATKAAQKLRNGQKISGISSSYLPSRYEKRMTTMYENWEWTKYGCYTNATKGAFGWGVAIHTATDVFSHSVYGYPNEDGKNGVRFYHDDEKNKNSFADKTDIVKLRFKIAKDVARNAVSKYLKNQNGAASDFVNLSGYKYNAKKFKLYCFKAYMKQVGSEQLAKSVEAYSVGFDKE